MVQMAQQQPQQQQMPPDPASSGPGSGAPGPAPSAPRKFAYLKHLTALHKDQHSKLQAKNAQELDLLDDIRKYLKGRVALEMQYADGMQKLSATYLSHKIANVPDIQTEENEQNAEVNVFNLWRRMLDEQEKIAQTRLANAKTLHDEVQKDAKTLRAVKQTKTKKAFERLATLQKDLQTSVAELDRTKRIYFGEETEAEAVRDKAKSAEDKARGRKKDMSSLFKSKAALKKQAGLLSAKEDELNIRSTGARNDYILNLSSSNAHQERYYNYDLQDTMKDLEGPFYEKMRSYMATISQTELQASLAMQKSFTHIGSLSAKMTRLYNYECYTKAFPSLGQHITYEHEAPAADNIRIITPSEHDGGYSLNYEARQNANKLNQSVRTIKAYRQRIKACYNHKANGLKKEPNDTGGPNIDTKINELELAIRDDNQLDS